MTPNKLTIMAAVLYALADTRSERGKLGKMWGDLSVAEKAPFLALADNISSYTFGAQTIDRTSLAAFVTKLSKGTVCEALNADAAANVFANLAPVLG